MSDLQKELGGALQLLSVIPVSGDSVEVMAAAKQKLRRALEMSNSGQQEGDVQDGR